MMNCKVFEGSSHGIIDLLLQYFPGGTEESHENQYWWCPDYSLNQALAEYKPGTLHNVTFQTHLPYDRSL
jgi:hypothetical protein